MSFEENIITPEEELPVTAPGSDAADILAHNLTAPSSIHQDPPVFQEIPAPTPKAERGKKPPMLLRILLQLISFVLAVVLFVTVTAGVLVADLRQLTSAGGIKQLISAIFDAATASAPVETPEEEPYISNLSNWTIHYDETEATGGSFSVIVDENGNTIIVDGNGNVVSGGDFVGENGNIVIGGEIPEDILTGGNTEENMDGLIDWIYDQMEESAGGELEVSKDQVQNFVEQSTVSDYLSEKLAGFAEDFINGTENTNITTDEIMDLLEENEELLKSELNIEFTPEQKAEIQESVDKMVVENDINNTIRQEVYDAVDSVLEESTESMGGVSIAEIQEMLKLLVSDSLYHFFIFISLVLLVLLCLVNFYNIPAALTWAGIPCILSGGILSLPIVLVEENAGLAAQAGSVGTILASFVNVLKPIHYGLVYIGVGLIVVSIIWRFIRAVIRKVQAG